MRQTIAILGVPVDILDMDQTLLRLEQFIQERRFHQVATANTDFLVNAMDDPELQHILRDAEMVVPDGMPLVWASRLMGSPLPERVTGADLVPRLAALSAQKGYRIYLLGARAEIAQRAKARLEADYPGVCIVGCVSPPPASIIEMNSEAVLADIERAAPDILLVAFGNPKQEKWIHMHRARLRNVPVCIGIGGTLDFIAGEVPRAPSGMQRSGLEWIYRLAHNPRHLWKRYGRDLAQGGPHLWRQWRTLRKQSWAGKFEMYVAQADDCTILSLMGDFKRADLPRFRTLATQALAEGSYLVLDLQGVLSLDTEVLGALIELRKHAVSCKRGICLVDVPIRITRILRANHIQESFLPIANSVAHAITEPHHGGLFWRIHRSQNAAVIRVHGASDQETVAHLERICGCLLDEGKQVALDIHGVSYIDSTLLAVLYRLQHRYTRGQESRFRISAGTQLMGVLTKAKLQDKFILCAPPEVPLDAEELPPIPLETRKTHRTGPVSEVTRLEVVRSS